MFKEIIEEIKKELKAYVQDLSIPLDDRWEAFCEARLGENKPWYEKFKVIDEFYGKNGVSWYDDFCLERHQTMEMDNLVQQFSENDKVTEDQVIRLKEEILSKFIWSFINDW